MHLLLTGWENTAAGVALQRTNEQHPAQGSVLGQRLGVTTSHGVPRFVAVPRSRQIGGQVTYARPSFLGADFEAFDTGDTPADAASPSRFRN